MNPRPPLVIRRSLLSRSTGCRKVFKSFLIVSDIEIKKFQIHDIDRLLVQCDSIDPEFEKFSDIGIGKLTDYAVKIRKYEPDYFENKRL